MIKHIVMWKIKESHEGHDKNALGLMLKNMLEDLTDKISQINELEVGINFNPSEAACDVVLYSSFDTIDDLQIYQKHPDHVKVAELVSELRTERRVVDYEI
ncbi:MAG: Dabb family protein [Thermodesulfobacteriota bacterium]